MALVLADRVKETSTTTGTGTYTLAGAVTGFESFGSIGNGNTTYYACTLGSDFEVGIGTYTASGTTLARTTILQSSNSDNAVDWGAGTKTLFCTQPAEKAVFLNASDNIELSDNEKIILGTGSDLEIYHDGSNSFIRELGTGRLLIDTNGTGIDLRKNASENLARFITDGAVELYHDNSKKLETTSTGATVTGTLVADGISVGDSEDISVGAGNDLRIFHDGTNSRIYGTTGDTNIGQNTFGAVKLTADNDQENMLVANVNGSVELYHDNSKKLETTSDGASITGDLTLTATDDSANSTPELKLVRHSASQADFDYIGGLSFFADNSADQNIEVGTLEARIRDVTDGTEDFAGFELFGIKDGTARQRFMILGQSIFHLMNKQLIRFDNITSTHDLDISPPSSLSTSQTITLPDATGTVLTTGNSDTPTTTTSSSDADFVLVDDGGTMKKITPSNLGITSGGTTAAFATAMAMVL